MNKEPVKQLTKEEWLDMVNNPNKPRDTVKMESVQSKSKAELKKESDAAKKAAKKAEGSEKKEDEK